MPDSFHAALLRGINLGGKNKLPMKDLAALFEKAGCKEVATYIQSGNVVFKAGDALAKQLPELIFKAIKKKFNLEIQLIFRSAAEIKRTAKGNPFFKPGADTKPLHVGFLAHKPSAAQIAGLDPARGVSGEKFEVRGSEVYFYMPLGLAKTKLTNAYFDSKLSSTMTVRNWNTVMKLLEMTS
jgi:uncharacterized protein (DUF1697 family)